MTSTRRILLALSTISLACSRPEAVAVAPMASVGIPAAASASSQPTPVPHPAAVAPSDGSGRSPIPLGQAVNLTVKGLQLGGVAVAAEPTSEHPRGVVAALGWPDSPGDVSSVAIDVATAAEIGRVRVSSIEEGGHVFITRAPRGVVIAIQGKTIDLVWVDGGTSLGARRTVPGNWRAHDNEIRGFEAHGDRLVMALGGDGTTTLLLLDDRGALLSQHACRGSLFAPGRATFVQHGDQILISNFMTTDAGQPVCAGYLHGPPRWRDAVLRGRLVWVSPTEARFESHDYSTRRALDENLQPTGPVLPEPKGGDASTADKYCDGITGIPWDWADVGGARVEHTVSCCGDPTPTGFFICPLEPLPK